MMHGHHTHLSSYGDIIYRALDYTSLQLLRADLQQ